MRSCLYSALLLACLIAPAAADDQLTVTGQGTVQARNDEARINGTAEARGATVAEALAAQKAVAAHLAAALTKLGVSEKDFAVSAININPQYGPGPAVNVQRTVTGYTANTQLIVVVEHVERLSDILQALSEAGLNQSAHVSFAIHDPSGSLALARAAAVKDAFARGQVLAQQTGVTLGAVTAVSDGPRSPQAANYVEQMMSAINLPFGLIQKISATVTISWVIKK